MIVQRMARLLVILMVVCCAKAPPATSDAGSSRGDGGPAFAGQIAISAATRTPRVGTLGLNYWMWSPTYGNAIAGTETAVGLLSPRFLRLGGHNNDANAPDPFDDAQLDAAVSYARAVGADVILQVPLLADEAGARPTAATAARMVTEANVTHGYRIRYFAIGNEPDLYPDQEPALAGYTPADYCASARAFATAMKAVDPTIQIVGPDLSWKYQPGQDWMTPILTTCGDVFDIVTFHRYPFAPSAATAAAAQSDAAAFSAVIGSLRNIMRAAGHADKPLALTEANITYDGAPEKSTLDASPGTVPAGLWTVDMLGTALSRGLWTTLLWSISEGWTLGLITPSPRTERPGYHAMALYAAHFGPTMIEVLATPPGVRAYASRDATETKTQIVFINWNTHDQAITFSVAGLGDVNPSAKATLGARTFGAVEIPDAGPALVWSYGEAQLTAKTGPVPVAAETASP